MLCCCWEKTVEKKTITKPLLAESKSLVGEPKILAERKLTGFESALSPSPLPSPVAVPKAEFIPIVAKPVVVKVEPEPEPEPVVESKPEPEPIVESKPEPVKPLPPKPIGPKPEPSAPIPIPVKPVIQTAAPKEQDPATFVEKNDFLPREKKNRSKSRR